MKEPYIDEDFLDLLPRPNKEQRKIIKNSLRKQGLLKEITTDQNGMVVDGHTRFELCDELGIKKRFVTKKFKDLAERISFAISVNRDRRHLNTFQIFEAFEKEIDIIRQTNITLRNQRIRETLKQGKKGQTLKMKREHSTMRQAMNLTGLSETSITLSIFLKNNGDEKIINRVREGRLALNKAVFELKTKLRIKKSNYDERSEYRSKIGIIMDIVSCIQNEPNLIISHICRKANLSHYTMKEYLNLLLSSNLITFTDSRKKTPTKKSIINYNITEKGIKFSNACKSMFNYLPEKFRL